MDPAETQASDRPHPTVFLSYASQDRAAVQRIRDALPALGLEVWYDESELLGGDAWDQKIRGQIRDCDFFMPVISANTEARREGYFRREWRLAVERALDMADDSVFLVPVVIDDTPEAVARVPEKFRAVQWVRVPDGAPNAALETLGRRLVSGEPEAPPARRAAKRSGNQSRPPPPHRAFRAFPREEPGQRVRFWAHVVGWVFQSAWIAFQRLPKVVRVLIYIWCAIVILQYSTGSSGAPPRTTTVSPKNLAQVETILKALPPSAPTSTAAKIFAQMSARQNGAGTSTVAGTRVSLLAIRFSAPPGQSVGGKLARAAFDQTFGQLLQLHHARVTLSSSPLGVLDATAATRRARAEHFGFVLYGGLSGQGPKRSLAVRIAAARGLRVWSKAYPTQGADPAQIATDVRAEVRRLETE
ncbi:MAG: toll/interleukin-1 receptor domain-containing protein [Steroidobacteraceae bacterium]